MEQVDRFNLCLKKTIEAMFQSRQQRPVLSYYQVAGLPLTIYYWSTELRDQYYRSLQHIENTASISSDIAFKLFVIPSSVISTNSCMITTRKDFLAHVCQTYHIEPESQDLTNMRTKTHEDFFYLIDMKKHFAIWVVNSYTPLHAWYRVSPFQHFFQEVMSLFNKQVTHAAVIANNEYGIILTGASGAGKTTTTLLAIQQGYHYVSEDYCVLTNDNAQLHAHSLYNSIKITENTSSALQALFTHEPLYIHAPSKLKKAYFLAEQEQITIKQNTPIRAICSLKITPYLNPVITEQSRGESIKSLAFSTIQQNPIYTRQSIKNFYAYTDNMPLFQLQLSTNFEKNLTCIQELFYELSSQN